MKVLDDSVDNHIINSLNMKIEAYIQENQENIHMIKQLTEELQR